MAIITLTTDLGSGDFYLSSLKAKIISQLPDVRLIDISNEIEKYNIADAAYVLKSVIRDFPKDTIHIVGVGTGALDDTPHLGIRIQDQFILAPDNGFISLIASHQPQLVVELNLPTDSDFLSFPARDLYAPVAVQLARGKRLEDLGNITNSYVKRGLFQPLTGPDYIRGMVIYVDDFGNAITNITEDLFLEFGKGREFLIGFVQKGYEIDRISKRYSDAPPGDRLAMFNSSGHLEISINQGHAANLLGMVKDEIVIITF